jgi:hypothetical protein
VRVQTDVFPAIIWITPPNTAAVEDIKIPGPSPEGTRKIDRVRIVLKGDQVLIATDTPAGVQIAFREKFTERHVDGKLNAVLTETGKVVAFIKDSNCGCGSRLRAWNPYGQNSSVYSSQDPTE